MQKGLFLNVNRKPTSKFSSLLQKFKYTQNLSTITNLLHVYNFLYIAIYAYTFANGIWKLGNFYVFRIVTWEHSGYVQCTMYIVHIEKGTDSR